MSGYRIGGIQLRLHTQGDMNVALSWYIADAVNHLIVWIPIEWPLPES
jgi:hypothetical protein